MMTSAAEANSKRPCAWQTTSTHPVTTKTPRGIIATLFTSLLDGLVSQAFRSVLFAPHESSSYCTFIREKS